MLCTEPGETTCRRTVCPAPGLRLCETGTHDFLWKSFHSERPLFHDDEENQRLPAFILKLCVSVFPDDSVRSESSSTSESTGHDQGNTHPQPDPYMPPPLCVFLLSLCQTNRSNVCLSVRRRVSVSPPAGLYWFSNRGFLPEQNHEEQVRTRCRNVPLLLV